MSIRDATAAQIRAANPAASTWVSANAGSGKTRVLTDRVARLLLHGTDPQKILCLTYTKAAAAEMQNRLFERLGTWAMMPDEQLRETLASLGEIHGDLGAENLRVARTLFANALETPGGLKIQTIHSFCDKLLRRFPLEAGVSPLFEVLEDRQAKLLREEVLEQLADGKATSAVDGLARYIGGTDPDDLLREVVSKRVSVCQPVFAVNFGIDERDTFEDIFAAVFAEGNINLLERAADTMQNGLVTDKKHSKSLLQLLAGGETLEAIQKLEKIFIYGISKKFGNNTARHDAVMTKAMQSKHPHLRDELSVYSELIEATRVKRIGIISFARAKALNIFSKAFLAEYDRRKSLTGKLDFDDLIAKAGALLGDSASAQWVLYKLDGGIDHILVDEAQDTSPTQWAVIGRLADEFTAGDGASDVERTLFVVGDEKQSIYSFQGADPAEFSKMRTRFEERYFQVGGRLERQDLLFSFRSADPIMRLVDKVFEGDAGEGLEGEICHRPIHNDMPGRVDLWPFLEVEKTTEDLAWFKPVDAPSPDDPRAILGGQVADWIAHVVDSNMDMPGANPPRAIVPGDILILVQSRGPLFKAIIKALKARNVAVAGADRLDVGQELAVRDILSLLKFADLPEDDLSLAEALRSPLFGFSEGELFTLAHGRKGSLWQQLRGMEDVHPNALLMLRKLLKQADFLRPFELIEMILTEFKGRENLVARLGSEVADGINELLSQSLRYEQVDVPTLAGFLHWFQSGKVEIKREMDSGANQVRVMTVHGAKGLEAPVVILPDTAKRRPPNFDQIVVLKDGSAVWKTDGKNATDAQLQALEKRKKFELQERMRLLYVAMTRAERWLVVCGAGDMGKEGESWYDLVHQGIEQLAVQQGEFPLMDGEKSLLHNWAETTFEGEELLNRKQPELPHWLISNAPTIDRPKQPLSPSKFEGAKALSGDGEPISEADALRKGRQVHLLLEHLAGIDPQDRSRLAERLLIGECAPKEAGELPQVLQEACVVLDNPGLAHIFTSDTMAEVGITARLPELGDQKIDGIIDRLIVTADKVLAIDFKTNQIVPKTPQDTPLGILRQLGAYAGALSQIYPGRKIEVAVLWTRNAQLMSISNDIVMHALQSTTTS